MDEMKKYIIEFSEDPHTIRLMKLKNGDECPATEFKTVTPYTEPDLERIKQKSYDKGYSNGHQDGYKKGMNDYLNTPDFEQVRKEAYEQGRKDVETQFCSYDACKNRQEEYLRGLADAWEAARKILFNPDDGGMSAVDVNEVFGENSWTVMKDFSASEVVAKIKEYEDSKHKIKVGDEVKCIEANWTAIVTKIKEESLTLMDYSGAIANGYKITRFVKTGRHFPEIAAVLAKIKEN